MINPNQVLSPAGQPGTNTPTMDSLNGAYSGAYATLDPSSTQPAAMYLGAAAVASMGQAAYVASPSFVSPPTFGVGAPVAIMGTPDSLGPASALSGQSTAGDAGVMSGMGVGQPIAADAGLAPATAADPGAAPTGGM